MILRADFARTGFQFSIIILRSSTGDKGQVSNHCPPLGTVDWLYLSQSNKRLISSHVSLIIILLYATEPVAYHCRYFELLYLVFWACKYCVVPCLGVSWRSIQEPPIVGVEWKHGFRQTQHVGLESSYDLAKKNSLLKLFGLIIFDGLLR